MYSDLHMFSAVLMKPAFEAPIESAKQIVEQNKVNTKPTLFKTLF